MHWAWITGSSSGFSEQAPTYLRRRSYPAMYSALQATTGTCMVWILATDNFSGRQRCLRRRRCPRRSLMAMSMVPMPCLSTARAS